MVPFPPRRCSSANLGCALRIVHWLRWTNRITEGHLLAWRPTHGWMDGRMDGLVWGRVIIITIFLRQTTPTFRSKGMWKDDGGGADWLMCVLLKDTFNRCRCTSVTGSETGNTGRQKVTMQTPTQNHPTWAEQIPRASYKENYPCTGNNQCIGGYTFLDCELNGKQYLWEGAA